jgi:AcrR family transcriptional regulator
MPRPRFEKLKKEKRERILEAAAKAFAADGFDGASLNQILEDASISKGAAYYYFDDKADLYATTVQHYLARLAGTMDLSVQDLTAETFWSRLREMYRAQFLHSYEQPWVFGVVKSAAHVPPALLENAALSGYISFFQDSITALLHKGQELGLVRTDLPQELLNSLFLAVDDTADQWFLAHWSEFSPAEIETVSQQIFETLQRLLEAR